MHRSSFEKMAAFRDLYLDRSAPLSILDVGSAAMDGPGYRPLFAQPGWRYTGLDLQHGPNVDLVPGDPYDWRQVPDASIGLVISGQAFEHIPWPWLTMMEIARVLTPGGLAAIVAPSSGPVHRFPRDCWRYYPDGFPALAVWAGLSVVEQQTDRDYAWPDCAFWGEVFVVLRRPERTAGQEDAWRARHAAARAAVRGLDPGPPPEPDASGPMSVHASQVLAGLSAWRVKYGLIADSLRRLRYVLRASLRDLHRP